jgi:hypothetical protein
MTNLRTVHNLTRAMSQLSPARSPTLSDMEEADSPTVKVKRDISTATPPPQPKPQPQRMSRYLPPDARDAFIGPLPPTTLVSAAGRFLSISSREITSQSEPPDLSHRPPCPSPARSLPTGPPR